MAQIAKGGKENQADPESSLCNVDHYNHVLEYMKWKVINGWLFKNEDPTIDQYKLIFKRELKLITHRSRRSYVPQLHAWLQNLD
jgi:hypothetical protein